MEIKIRLFSLTKKKFAEEALVTLSGFQGGLPKTRGKIITDLAEINIKLINFRTLFKCSENHSGKLRVFLSGIFQPC